ncbi:MAG: hypothetical protein SFU84_15160 [Gemmatimonadales bacterium]|nr:hypothetical protein [Gemmatimonadales bacterium]
MLVSPKVVAVLSGRQVTASGAGTIQLHAGVDGIVSPGVTLTVSPRPANE